ncbi:hypothetical protein QBC38DRAFT_517745 [Podospora fimiseda]|uniref:Uncharacterized protein n=1 Tax=Podospora fimiseda TaxID=252190 RepID=A0AAN7BGV5_9PEZI|nr:hypothetical protein QBC38DRAFT_517745 [Podospora fimiseda]
MLDAQCTAPRCFGPAVNGLLWRKALPGEKHQNQQLDTTPILSILKFRLKPEIDMRDESGSPRKIWDSTLKYIRFIPRFLAVEWGTILHHHPTSIFCLIHWDSTASWYKFQYSSGIHPVMMVLDSYVSNRCAKLEPSCPVPLPGFDKAIVVDVISVIALTEYTLSPEDLSAFEERWKTLVAAITNSHHGLQHSTRPVEELCTSLHVLSSTVSRKAVQLVAQSVHPQNHHTAPPQQEHHSLESILKVGLPRQCTPDLANLKQLVHETLRNSREDARRRTRLFPAPSQSSTPMHTKGHLYEGNAYYAPNRLFGNPPTPINNHNSVDIAPRIYSHLKEQLSVLQGFVQMFWARDAEKPRNIAIFTVWENVQAREAASRNYRRILSDFVASSIYLIGPLKHQTFLRPPSNRSYPFPDRKGPYLEFISYYVPRGAVQRQVFEHAYATITNMTNPHVQEAISTACIVWTGHELWEPDVVSDVGPSSSPNQLFTGIICWRSPEARKEWYQELYRLACFSYELFGYKVDALGIIAAGGIESRFVEMQPEPVR